MLRVGKAALGAAVLGGLLFSGGSADAAGTRAGGMVKVWATPPLSGQGGPVVITGAIGDYGNTLKVDSAGKADKKGLYTMFTLTKGTILINGAQLNAAIQNGQPTDLNAATCSGSQSASEPVAVVSGTKAYAGITGSLTATARFGFVLPRTPGGKCDDNANPIASSATITGSGTVTFG